MLKLTPEELASVREDVQRANAIEEIISHYFVGEGPGIIGSVLAGLMAQFLHNHQIPDDLREQSNLREQLLMQWCATVGELVACKDREQGGTIQ